MYKTCLISKVISAHCITMDGPIRSNRRNVFPEELYMRSVLGPFLILILVTLLPNREYIFRHMASSQLKYTIITGGNTGIGFETAKNLLETGTYFVIIGTPILQIIRMLSACSNSISGERSRSCGKTEEFDEIFQCRIFTAWSNVVRLRSKICNWLHVPEHFFFYQERFKD